MPRLSAPVVPAGTVSGRTQPRLTVDELLVRPWEPGDAAGVVRAYADPAIRRWHDRSMSRAEALDWVASWSERWSAESGGSWAVVDGTSLLGRVGVQELDLAAGLGEASYWVLPEARGRAVAPRAIGDWWFASVGLQRIELAHSIANAASCRVAEKAGYVLEGIKRRECLHEDGWHDMHLHARLRDDPAPPG